VPIRTVIALNLGPPFGGFRIALRAGALGLNWPEAFAALEAAASTELQLLAALTPERRARMREEPLPARPPPQYGDRLGVIDGMMAPTEDRATLLLLRAIFPFRFWPLGGWAVYVGARIGADNQVETLSTEQLEKYW
jgi:hypothetical protein